MLGGNRAASEGCHGDAVATVNFADADVDVAFTNIHELFTGAAQSDISYNGVPLTPDSFASGARPNNRIAATFYGADHAEVGGTFEHDDVLGAFGARNDEWPNTAGKCLARDDGRGLNGQLGASVGRCLSRNRCINRLVLNDPGSGPHRFVRGGIVPSLLQCNNSKPDRLHVRTGRHVGKPDISR